MNVHRLNDLPPDSNRRMHSPRQRGPPQPQGRQEEDNGMPWGGYAPMLTMEHIQFAEKNRVLLVSGHQQVKDPRQ